MTGKAWSKKGHQFPWKFKGVGMHFNRTQIRKRIPNFHNPKRNALFALIEAIENWLN